MLRGGAQDVGGGFGIRGPAYPEHAALALTNTVPITAYRGAGRPDMAHAVERLVDEAARQLGQVLGELRVHDEHGQLLSGSFMDYAMPRAEALPGITLLERPVPSPNNPLGVKGAGEAGTTGSLPAAMNAVLDALRPAGVRRLDVPASAQRVWAAIRLAAG